MRFAVVSDQLAVRKARQRYVEFQSALRFAVVSDASSERDESPWKRFNPL